MITLSHKSIGSFGTGHPLRARPRLPHKKAPSVGRECVVDQRLLVVLIVEVRLPCALNYFLLGGDRTLDVLVGHDIAEIAVSVVFDSRAESRLPSLPGLKRLRGAVPAQLDREVRTQGVNGVGLAVHSGWLVFEPVGSSVELPKRAQIAFAALVLKGFWVP